LKKKDGQLIEVVMKLFCEVGRTIWE
jgi:hypothetical protein